MKLTIETIPESNIAYFRNIGEYGGKQNKALMQDFKEWVSANYSLSASTILGIPRDNPEITPKEACRYDVCVLIGKEQEVKKPAKVGIFLGGKYAVFLIKHTYEAINSCWEHIFSSIEEHQLTVRNQPIVERYTPQMIEEHTCEILVPIQ